MGKQETGAMTAEQAVRFERQSPTSAAILAMAAAERGCECEAYRDWYTYRRWQAQGYQVRRGEHGVKLLTYAEVKVKADGGDGDDGATATTQRRPVATTVFCRCQVDRIGGGDGDKGAA